MSLYTPLADFLSRQIQDVVHLSFQEIEALIGKQLPRSAYQHQAWWANSKTADTHTWAHLWISAGWERGALDLPGTQVTFNRVVAQPLPAPVQRRFWWVNHKQTHLDEYAGGYIWSPKTNRNGAANQTYQNLTAVSAGDLVVSYADGVIKALGVATDAHREAPIPTSHWEAAEYWGALGWMVPIEWTRLHQPIAPKAHLKALADLLPDKHSPLQKTSGNGNQGCYLASISAELGRLVVQLAAQSDLAVLNAVDDLLASVEEDQAERVIVESTIPVTEKQQLVRSRIGQGQFRLRVLEKETRCRFTGVEDESFLIASHIKPWRDASNSERLDSDNGLMLAPHVDKLFDRGWLSFADNGDVLIATAAKAVVAAWGLAAITNVGAFSNAQQGFLRYHREHIFKGDGSLLTLA